MLTLNRKMLWDSIKADGILLKEQQVAKRVSVWKRKKTMSHQSVEPLSSSSSSILDFASIFKTMYSHQAATRIVLHICRHPSRSLACFVMWIKSSIVLRSLIARLTRTALSPFKYIFIYGCYDSCSGTFSEFSSLTCGEILYPCFVCSHVFIHSQDVSQ